MDWSCAFVHLCAVDQVRLGLCSRRAVSNFWRCLGFKLWYRSIPHNRKVRKLCLEGQQFNFYSEHESWDNVSHLHLRNTDHRSYANLIVLPCNLTYFCAEIAYELAWKLPLSLTYFETHDRFAKVVNLDNHVNLTVLRGMDHNPAIRLPPNLIELVTARSYDVRPYPPMPRLPKLTTLHMGDYRNDFGSIEPFCHMRHASFNVHRNTRNIGLLPALFPSVSNLEIFCREPSRFLCAGLPAFHSVRSLYLELPVTKGSIVYGTTGLKTWKNLEELTLVLDEWDESGIPKVVDIPPTLLKLKIATLSNIALNIRVHISSSLTHLSLESERPVFDISISENAKLRTLRTYGNVFAEKIMLPESLRLFRVQLPKGEPLTTNWDLFATNIDFQVFEK